MRSRPHLENYAIFGAYLLLSILFYASSVDLLKNTIASGDAVVHGVPAKILSSKLGLWNPYVQSGTFALKDIGNQALYLPGIIVMRIFPSGFGYNLLLLLHYAGAGFFLFKYLRILGLRRLASFMGGLCFIFSGFLAGHKNHSNMVSAAIWLPFILYFVERYLREKGFLFLFLSAIGFSLSVLADYTAISMYIGMVACSYLFFRIWVDGRMEPPLKRVRRATIGSLMIFGGGLLLSAMQVFPIVESLRVVTRESVTYDFFASYSFPFRCLPLLFFPFFYGTHSPGFYQTVYHGPWNLTEIAGYMGILPVLFAFLALVLWRRENRQIRFWSFVAAFGFLLVLGDSIPLHRVMYHVPIYNLFRAPARNWFEVNFAVAVLTGFALHYFIAAEASLPRRFGRWRKVSVWSLGGITAGILVMVAVAHRLIPTLKPERLDQFRIVHDMPWTTRVALDLFVANTRLSSPAIYIPLIIIGLSIVSLIYLRRYHNRRAYWIVVGSLIFMDLFSFGHFHDNASQNFLFKDKAQNEVYAFLNKAEKDAHGFRILPLEMTERGLYPLLNTLYEVNVVNGYGPIWLKRYKSLTSFEANGMSGKPYPLINNSTVLSSLSVKYILTSNDRDKASMEFIYKKDQSKPEEIEEVIVDRFSQRGWYFYTPRTFNEDLVMLQSKAGSDVSLVQYPFKLERNSDYLVLFEARSHRSLAQPLMVGFYTDPSYDHRPREERYDGTKIGADYKRFAKIFNSGPDAPDKTNLRFFTFSTTPIEIRMVRLAKLISRRDGGRKPEPASIFPVYTKEYETKDGMAVYENRNFLPRARFVQYIQKSKDFAEVSEAMWNRADVDPSTSAFVEGYDGEEVLDLGEVIEADYSKNDSVRLSVRTGARSFLILADTYYSGWKAYVDQKEAKIFRTNGVMRGILIEGRGDHRVDFVFRPKSFYLGLSLSLLSFWAGASLAGYEHYSLIRRQLSGGDRVGLFR